MLIKNVSILFGDNLDYVSKTDVRISKNKIKKIS